MRELPAPSFVQAVKTCLSKYLTFSGRARRSEYWYFYLFGLIFGLPFNIISTVNPESMMSMATGGIAALIALLLLLPSIAVGVRRLHDVGKSGAWLLIGLIPFIGAIWLLILFLKDSDPQPNQYGPSPKYIIE